ncbi:hypothetical protein UlMin_008284 [Ulmus minor]
MGRLKLKIKRLESTSNRQVTYSKRRSGILKKAKELSILCDIDIALLMFSPTARPTLFEGERSNFEEVITKFSHLTPQERTKRKLESLEALKKTFKKLDHDVNVQDFMSSSSQTVEDLTNQVRGLDVQVAELHGRLRCWNNPDKINDVEHLTRMEALLRESINRIHLFKENFGKQHLMPLNCTGQLQNEMSLPLIVGGVQEAETIPWIPNNETQYMIPPNEANFLPQGDLQCSTDASFPGCSSYFGSSCGKQIEVGDPGQLDNIWQSLEFGEQYAYPSFTTTLPNENRLKPESDMNNLQATSADYQVNSNCELPRPLYNNNNQHAWVPSFSPCGVALYNENAYQQQLK